MSEYRARWAREMANSTPCEESVEDSPCGRYRLTVTWYGEPSRAVVTRVATGEVVAVLVREDSGPGDAWVIRPDGDYLFYPEVQDGQSVVDLRTGEVAGYHPDRDGDFIMTRVVPSPDGTRLAAEGCYWACSYDTAIYDFREPMKLPLTELARHLSKLGNVNFVGWDSADSYRTQVNGEGAEESHTLPAAGPA